MCNIVEKLLMLKIGPLNLLIFSKIWIRHPESGKQHPATSGIRNLANLTSGTSLAAMALIDWFNVSQHVMAIYIAITCYREGRG